MTDAKKWSPTAQSVCEICSLIWGLSILGGCTYAVFVLGASGWWFLLAVLLVGGWNCKYLGSPAQIRAQQQGFDNDSETK